MAKLPWYMKAKGLTIKFHWLWVLWQVLKIKYKQLVKKSSSGKTKQNDKDEKENVSGNLGRL